MPAKAFFVVCLLCVSLFSVIQEYNFKEETPEQATIALRKAGFDSWVLTPNSPTPGDFNHISISGKTADGVIAVANQYDLSYSSVTCMFLWKIELIRGLSANPNYILPDFAFYNNEVGALVTLEGTPSHPKPAVSATFDQAVATMNVRKYKHFLKKLLRILADLEKKGAVFLNIHAHEIGLKAPKAADPIITSVAGLFPVGNYVAIADKANTKEGPTPVARPGWLQSIGSKLLSPFVKAPSPVATRRAKTQQEEFKLLHHEGSSKSNAVSFLDNADNKFFMIMPQANWSWISFVALLKEHPLPNELEKVGEAFVQLRDAYYAELESGDPSSLSLAALSDLLNTLPAQKSRKSSNNASSSDSSSSSGTRVRNQ